LEAPAKPSPSSASKSSLPLSLPSPANVAFSTASSAEAGFVNPEDYLYERQDSDDAETSLPKILNGKFCHKICAEKNIAAVMYFQGKCTQPWKDDLDYRLIIDAVPNLKVSHAKRIEKAGFVIYTDSTTRTSFQKYWLACNHPNSAEADKIPL